MCKFTSKSDDLDFANDVVLISSTKQHRIDDEARRVGLKINVEKKLMRINAKNQQIIKTDGQGIEEVDDFTYLGATHCKEGGGMKDLKNRLSKARSAFVRLRRIWCSKNIPRRTKLRLYKSRIWKCQFCYMGVKHGK